MPFLEWYSEFEKTKETIRGEHFRSLLSKTGFRSSDSKNITNGDDRLTLEDQRAGFREPPLAFCHIACLRRSLAFIGPSSAAMAGFARVANTRMYPPGLASNGRSSDSAS